MFQLQEPLHVVLLLVYLCYVPKNKILYKFTNSQSEILHTHNTYFIKHLPYYERHESVDKFSRDLYFCTRKKDTAE